MEHARNEVPSLTLARLERETHSRATRDQYAGDWARFRAWCDDHEIDSMPADPNTIRHYIVAMVDNARRVTTIRRALSAISFEHKKHGYPSPVTTDSVRQIMQGVRRDRGVSQDRSLPIMQEHLERIVFAQNEKTKRVKAIRDTALILIGFSAAMRRSEIAALTKGDIEEVGEGLRITIRVSKTDQEAAGRVVGVPFAQNNRLCPVLAVRRWNRITDVNDKQIDLFKPALETQYVFRQVNDRKLPIADKPLSGSTINQIVKDAVELAGYDPALYSAHGLRSGFCTAAAAAGKLERDIRRQTGHRSDAGLKPYIFEGQLFDVNNPARGLL